MNNLMIPQYQQETGNIDDQYRARAKEEILNALNPFRGPLISDIPPYVIGPSGLYADEDQPANLVGIPIIYIDPKNTTIPNIKNRWRISGLTTSAMTIIHEFKHFTERDLIAKPTDLVNKVLHTYLPSEGWTRVRRDIDEGDRFVVDLFDMSNDHEALEYLLETLPDGKKLDKGFPETYRLAEIIQEVSSIVNSLTDEGNINLTNSFDFDIHLWSNILRNAKSHYELRKRFNEKISKRKHYKPLPIYNWD